MESEAVHLNCAGTRFGSYLDEKHLFTWAEEISCFERWDRDTLVLRSQNVPEEALRELLALFWRYQIPMRQLAQFEADTNRHWFSSPTAYWYGRVFESDGLNSGQ
jgi:hypothetical protein